MSGTATARRRIIELAVIKVVVVCELFPGFDAADGANNHTAVYLVGFAIGIARVIDECRDAIAIDDVLTVDQAEQVRARGKIVNCVCLLVGQTRAGVFDDDGPPLYGCGRVNAVSVDL